jgi:hypothetical protein
MLRRRRKWSLLLGAGVVGSLLALGGCNDESEQPGLEPAPTDRTVPSTVPPPTTPPRTSDDLRTTPGDLGTSPAPPTRPSTPLPPSGSGTGTGSLPPDPTTTPVTPGGTGTGNGTTGTGGT